MEALKRFSEKVVIVTGAAQGIGRAIALDFAKEGAKLLLLDIMEEPLESLRMECRDLGGDEPLSLRADVGEAAEFESAVQRTVDTFGRVDVLVNNAGVLPASQPFELTSDRVWEKALKVNLMGVVNGCRSVIPYMKEQRSGRIINASSMYGIVPQFRSAPYCAAKAAIISVTRVLASELGPFGITVNAYAPGATRTPLAAHSLEGSRGAAKLREIPMGRFAEPQDIARVVLFLASDDAGFINGVTLLVDGGTLAIQSPTRATDPQLDD